MDLKGKDLENAFYDFFNNELKNNKNFKTEYVKPPEKVVKLENLFNNSLKSDKKNLIQHD